MRNKKQSRELVKAIRDARTKQKKFLELKKEAIKACQSMKKAISSAEEKLKKKAIEIGPIVNRFNTYAQHGLFYARSESESDRGNPHIEEDIDFEDLRDTIQTMIDEIKEVDK